MSVRTIKLHNIYIYRNKPFILIVDKLSTTSVTKYYLLLDMSSATSTTLSQITKPIFYTQG